jgi:hypothetical protein
MPVFRRRSAGATDGTAQDSPGAQSPDSPAEEKIIRPAEAAKGRPTPKRSEAERGRYQPIGGRRGRAAGPRTAADKTRDRGDRARRYEAQKAGEEWALPAKDRGPVRKLARDYVDSRRWISEYYMYILVILVVALFIRNKTIQTYLAPFVLVLVLVVAVEGWFIRRGLRKLLAERLPGESARGLTTYTVMRAIQIRRFRMPQPRVRPGDRI